MVDITGLPETGYERLVGRDAELRRLNEAWGDRKTNILSLIAEGGAGKSALVNEWLMRLQAEAIAARRCVLGWSFYSQGSKERATAADEFLNWALAKLDVKLDDDQRRPPRARPSPRRWWRAACCLCSMASSRCSTGRVRKRANSRTRACGRSCAALRRAARADHSLIVLTSRSRSLTLKRFKGGAAPVVDVERLSDEAGVELLRDNGVWGTDTELRAASRDFGGHPLALTLLASFLKETQSGDVRRRDHIRACSRTPTIRAMVTRSA